MADYAVACPKRVYGEFLAVNRDVRAVGIDNTENVLARKVRVNALSLGASASENSSKTRIAPENIALFAHCDYGIFVSVKIIRVKAADVVCGVFYHIADISAKPK